MHAPARPASFAGSPVELLRQLIRFDTTNPPGNERACVMWLEELLRNAGLDTLIVAPDPERPNLVARLRGRGAAAPLLLYGHVDVAPTTDQHWSVPPFEGRAEEGWIWGRGTLDMKGLLAAMLASVLRAAREGLQPAGDVVFCALVDEEAGSFAGARHLVHSRGDLFAGVWCGVSEASFAVRFAGRRLSLIQVAEKQICRLRVTVRGAAHHGAIASRGESTPAVLGETLARLEHARLPIHITPAARLALESIAWVSPLYARPALGALVHPTLSAPALRLLGKQGHRLGLLLRNTVTVMSIRAGDSLNSAPSHAELDLDGRLLPGLGPDVLRAELAAVLGPGVEFETVFHDPGPTSISLEAFPLLEEILRTADPQTNVVPFLLPGSTDARFFDQLGIQTYGFPPLRLPREFDFVPTIHGPDERVTSDAIEFASECLDELLRRYR